MKKILFISILLCLSACTTMNNLPPSCRACVDSVVPQIIDSLIQVAEKASGNESTPETTTTLNRVNLITAPLTRYLDIVSNIITVASGVPYCTSPNLLFDLYTPATDSVTNRPCVIWFHSGDGVREDEVHRCMKFARRGYVAISPDYRSDPGDFGEENQKIAVSDAWALRRYIVINSARLGIDPKKIFVAGTSAGALVALESGIAANDIRNSFFNGSKLNQSNGGIQGFDYSVVASATISGAAAGTFMNLINAGDQENYFFNGEKDDIILFSQAQSTFDKLDKVAPGSTLTSFPAGHKLGAFYPQIIPVIISNFYNKLISIR